MRAPAVRCGVWLDGPVLTLMLFDLPTRLCSQRSCRALYQLQQTVDLGLTGGAGHRVEGGHHLAFRLDLPRAVTTTYPCISGGFIHDQVTREVATRLGK